MNFIKKNYRGLLGGLALAVAGLTINACDLESSSVTNYTLSSTRFENIVLLLEDICKSSDQYGGLFNYPEYNPLFDIGSNKFKVYDIDVRTTDLNKLEIAFTYEDFYRDKQWNFELKAEKDSNGKFDPHGILINYDLAHNPVEILEGIKDSLDYGANIDWSYFTLANNWETGITVGVTPEDTLEGQGLSFRSFPKIQNTNTQRKYRVHPDDLGKKLIVWTPSLQSYGSVIHKGENGAFALNKNGTISPLEKYAQN